MRIASEIGVVLLDKEQIACPDLLQGSAMCDSESGVGAYELVCVGTLHGSQEIRFTCAPPLDPSRAKLGGAELARN